MIRQVSRRPFIKLVSVWTTRVLYTPGPGMHILLLTM